MSYSQTSDRSPVNMNDVSIVHSSLFHGLKCLLCAHTEAQHVHIHHFLEAVRGAVCEKKCELLP